MAADNDVYLGFWINWTDGLALGSTLTLTTRSGAFLIAFLALYVAVAGSHCWQLLSWALFQLRTKQLDGRASDRLSLKSQQQSVLRNTNSATHGLVELIKTDRKWSTKATLSQRVPQSVTPILMAISTLAIFGTAGIFSSRVTSTRSDILLLPKGCGQWPEFADGIDNYDDAIARTPIYAGAWTGQTIENMAESSHLNRYCYGSETSRSTKRCNAPGRTFANWSSSMQDSCPFGNVPCNTTQSLVLDSGLVDSHTHLGINAPSQDRVAFRKTLTCSVVNHDKYVRRFDWSNVTTAFPEVLGWLLQPEINYSNVSHFYAYDFGSSAYGVHLNTTYLWDSSRGNSWNSGPLSGMGPAYTVQ